MVPTYITLSTVNNMLCSNTLCSLSSIYFAFPVEPPSPSMVGLLAIALALVFLSFFNLSMYSFFNLAFICARIRRCSSLYPFNISSLEGEGGTLSSLA